MSPPLSVFLLFSSIFILQISVTSSLEDTIDPKEKTALLNFLNNIKHDRDKLNWNPSEPACTWKGITCDPDNLTVIHLRLKSKTLVGNIPPNTIGTLRSLRVLSLRVNKLSGSIPPDFEQLTSLTTLSLYNNSFTGQLPFIDAKELFSFNVSMNKLNTSIPSFFSKFPKSSFSINVYVCGEPFNITCNDSYIDPKSHQKNETLNKNHKREGEIVGISVGSGLVLLILLCCVRKTLDDPTRPRKRALARNLGGGKGEGEGKKKKSLKWFENGVYGFDLEEFLRASAEFLGEGSVGKSYKQVVGEGKRMVVVKRLKDVVVTEIEFGTIMEGLGKMKNTKKVVPLRGYYYSKEEKWLVFDYMPRGSLALHLHEEETKSGGGAVLVELFSSQGYVTTPLPNILFSRLGREDFNLGIPAKGSVSGEPNSGGCDVGIAEKGCRSGGGGRGRRSGDYG
ncbi:hypothetical protein SSX86_032758 [Deinandra increscens subsp. villosa]|uniref:Protein kinase domain-containing protein n=1 Tax=Deinandra increscens subsp. villosa TaxID=3103831 RepID=A0AAP0C712_9ASTR